MKAARRYYQAVLDHHPDDVTILLQLSALEAREKNATAMVARLNQAIEAHPMAEDPAAIRARLNQLYHEPFTPPATLSALSEKRQNSAFQVTPSVIA